MNGMEKKLEHLIIDGLGGVGSQPAETITIINRFSSDENKPSAVMRAIVEGVTEGILQADDRGILNLRPATDIAAGNPVQINVAETFQYWADIYEFLEVVIEDTIKGELKKKRCPELTNWKIVDARGWRRFWPRTVLKLSVYNQVEVGHWTIEKGVLPNYIWANLWNLDEKIKDYEHMHKMGRIAKVAKKQLEKLR